MTFKGLGGMFEGDPADMCAGKFPQVSMGCRAEGLACADPRARTPIGASGIQSHVKHKDKDSYKILCLTQKKTLPTSFHLTLYNTFNIYLHSLCVITIIHVTFSCSKK